MDQTGDLIGKIKKKLPLKLDTRLVSAPFGCFVKFRHVTKSVFHIRMQYVQKK